MDSGTVFKTTSELPLIYVADAWKARRQKAFTALPQTQTRPKYSVIEKKKGLLEQTNK